MALTVTPVYKWAWMRSEFYAIVQVAGDTSYPAAGYPLTAANFTFNTFASTSDSQLQAPPANPVGVWADGGHTSPGAGGYAQIDNTTGNLRLYAGGGTEVSTSGNASTYVTMLQAYGH